MKYCVKRFIRHTSCRRNLKSYLHELKRSLKILHRIHFDPEELHAHDETDNALHYVWTLLFLPKLLQFCDEFFPHCLKPERTQETLIYAHQSPYKKDSLREEE